MRDLKENQKGNLDSNKKSNRKQSSNHKHNQIIIMYDTDI